MMDDMEKAYFFDKNEFRVLLILGNIKKLYCFDLLFQEELDEKVLAMAIYSLTKRGCIQMGQSPMFSEEIAQYLEILRTAETAFQSISAGEHLQRCGYISRRGVVLVELSPDGREVRMSERKKEAFRESFFEGTGVCETAPETDYLGEELERFHENLTEEKNSLFSEQQFQMGKSLSVWLDAEAVESVWEIADMKAHCIVGRLAFVEGSIHSWVILLDGKEKKVRVDSLEFRENFVKWLFGEGRYESL